MGWHSPIVEGWLWPSWLGPRAGLGEPRLASWLTWPMWALPLKVPHLSTIEAGSSYPLWWGNSDGTGLVLLVRGGRVGQSSFVFSEELLLPFRLLSSGIQGLVWRSFHLSGQFSGYGPQEGPDGLLVSGFLISSSQGHVGQILGPDC